MATTLKYTWKTELAPLLMLAAAAVFSFYSYSHFPARVASHWDIRGQVNGWSGRGVAAFGVPIMALALYLLFLVLPRLDPKRDRYAEFADVYHVFKAAVVDLLVLVYFATGLFNLGFPVRIDQVIPVLIGLLFVLIGALLPRIKNNWFMGIRTPWTLSSEKVWDKTHRVGGRLFIVFGLLIMMSPFLPQAAAVAVFIAGLAALLIGTVGYSYYAYAREMKAKPPTPHGN